MNGKLHGFALVTAITLTAAFLATAAADGQRAARAFPWPRSADSGDPQIVTLTSIKDNTLHESVDGSKSNGQGSHVFVGNTNGGVIRRAVLEFDVAGALPAGAEVDSVILRLNMSRTSSGAQIVRLHRLTKEWGEGESNADANEGGGAPSTTGDATWIHTHHADQTWTTPGGDFVAAASAQTTVGDAGLYEWSASDMEDEVEAWLADPDSNHGWILIAPELGNDGSHLARTSKRFDSRENADSTVRPVLVVVYRVDDSTATPETSTPETSTPKTSTPETSTPETSTPETSTPETSTPETSTPETSTPETSTPETSTPETSTPETSTPETSTPETSTPETSTPETFTPETPTPTTSPATPSPETATPVPGQYWIYLPIAKRGA